jgi:hypothetical protein
MSKTRQEKKAEADARKAANDVLDINARIQKLKSRPGECKKELARLLKLKEEKKK